MSFERRPYRFGAFIAVVLSLVIVTASSGNATIGVSPLSANVPARESAAAFTVNNIEANESTVQVEVFRWERVAGQDRLTKSVDWIVNPPVLQIPALGTRVVRMALKHRGASAEEGAYRIILTEIHAAPRQQGLAVAINMHMSLPVFVEPITESRKKPEWSAKREGANKVVVAVNNLSARHVHVTGFSIKDGAGRVVETHVPSYVFAGEERTFTLMLDPTFNARIATLEVLTDEGPQGVAVAGQ